MRFVLSRLIVGCFTIAACGWWSDNDFPESAVKFTPPAYFQTWWQVVELCSGRSAPFSEVAWYTAPHSELVVRGEPAFGAWFADRNRIALADENRESPSLVRHEMLHAILREGDHPPAYFHERCGDEVICGRECGVAMSLEHAHEIARQDLTVHVQLFPEMPSLTAQQGKATIVVHLRNPSNETVFARMGAAICYAGFLIASVSNPSRRKQGCGDPPQTIGDRVFFAPGEILRLIFEADLLDGWANGPPGAGPISVSAIMADNVRETRFTSILP